MENLAKARSEAADKALTSLANYKFIMFGYHAAIWVTLNQLSPRRQTSPFSDLVTLARLLRKGQTLSKLIREDYQEVRDDTT